MYDTNLKHNNHPITVLVVHIDAEKKHETQFYSGLNAMHVTFDLIWPYSVCIVYVSVFDSGKH